MAKGQASQILFLLLMTGLLAGIIVFFYAYTLIVPLVSKTTNQITSLTTDIADDGNPDNGNITESLTTATKPINGINQVLSWFGYVMALTLLIAYLIIVYNVRSHPYLGVFWIFLVVVIGILAMWLSNSYDEIKQGDAYLKDALESNVVNNYFMNYLPHIVMFFGFAGGILLFVLVSKDPDMEASYV